MDPAGDAKRRIAFLDAVRGIAATAVMLQHALPVVTPGFDAWSRTVFNPGLFGVAAFFLVSGFVIPGSLERGGVGGFWQARVFRLLPVYWLSIVLAAVLAVGAALPPRAVLVNLTMAQEFVGVPHLLNVYWTLSVELVFYLLCTVLAVLRWHRRPLLLAWLALLAVPAASCVLPLLWPHPVPTVRLALLATAFAGAVWHGLRQGTIGRRAWAGLLTGAALLLPLAFWVKAGQAAHDPLPLDLTPVALALTWAAAFACVALLARLDDAAVPGPLQRLGRASYALYLLHPIVLAVTARWIADPALWFAAATGASLLLAALTHAALEQPFIRLGRRWRRGT
jgi:peptidoglycan/LPS O-acetylase OafA/YrhL